MKLRRQLIIVSLLTLSLPWAGCQYIREMEAALRQGQTVALTASAQAVAARLASEVSLRVDLSKPASGAAPERQLYLHPLPAAAIVDGYDDDWRGLDFTRQTLAPNASGLKVTYWAGAHGEQVYLFLNVTDPVITYHNPGRSPLASGDHLLVRTGARDIDEYVIHTSAPGSLTALYINRSGQVRQEYAVRGAWRERSKGYQIELQLPRDLIGDRLGFAVVDQNDDGTQPGYVGTLEIPPGALGKYPLRHHSSAENSRPAPYISQEPALTEAISVFAGEGLRLRVATVNQWLVAESGQLVTRRPVTPQQHGLLTRLYRLALGERDLPALDQPARSGRFTTPEVQRALEGHSEARWYQDGPRRVGRAAVPIRDNGRILGAVVAEQSTDAMLALTNQAFNRLFFYTLLATAVAGAGLLAYASWLSFRIRRLSRAADTAIGEDGRILGNFPASRARDEVGDLSRSYGELLNRLKEYTDYLKTLSGKLSHELRTPLAVVRSSLDNLEHEPLPEQARTYAERAREGAGRLSAILTAMSAASRVEESIRSAEVETFALDALLTEVVAAYRDIYPQARLALAIESIEEGYCVQGSPELVVQMLDKLVDNAADFCPAEGVIELSLSRVRRQLCLRVANDGPPLPERMQGQLFDSLVSIRSGKGDKAHLGLGLHVVRLIVEFHRGRVSARNRSDGTGVVFEILLEAAEA